MTKYKKRSKEGFTTYGAEFDPDEKIDFLRLKEWRKAETGVRQSASSVLRWAVGMCVEHMDLHEIKKKSKESS
jgi:regulator of protease activity HflC (stomatin/prohibitin superfamily)